MTKRKRILTPTSRPLVCNAVVWFHNANITEVAQTVNLMSTFTTN